MKTYKGTELRVGHILRSTLFEGGVKLTCITVRKDFVDLCQELTGSRPMRFTQEELTKSYWEVIDFKNTGEDKS